MIDSLRKDLVYAIRGLRKNPGYTAVTVLTLALGIGANTAIFSVINGVLLKPLPYPAPDRLVFITSQFPALGFDQFWVSAPEFLEFRERNRSFQDVGAYRAGAVNLGTEDVPRRVNSAIVTSELMPVLGVAAQRGRHFTREDTLPGAEDVAILSDEIWDTAFGRDEGVVGRVIRIDGTPTRIVGIMPPGYDVHDEKVLVWRPLTLDPANPGGRGGHFLYLVGRLKDGVTMPQAAADVETMLEQWPTLNQKTHTPNLKQHRLRLDGLQTDLVGGIQRALWVLQGAVGFVLLIACANLANLLLARAESRQKEFAVRSALGASRWHLVRQFLTEGVLLALVGGTLGATAGFAGLRAMIAANPQSLPRAAEITLDPWVLVFTLLVSIVTGVLFGLAPLLQLRERVVSLSLKEGGQRTTGARTRLRNALVVSEIALAVVLVIGAGLLLRSFWNLMQVDAGFKRNQLATFGLVLPNSLYREPQARVDFFRRLTGELRQVPGVQSAATMTGLPPQRLVNANDTDIDGYTAPPEGPFENVDYYQTVTQDYLSTLGIPVVEGRDFALSDATGPPVAMINETLARTFFADQERGRPPYQTGLRRSGAVVHDRRRGARREAGGHRQQDRHRAVPAGGTTAANPQHRARQHERRAAIVAAGGDAGTAHPADRPGHGSDAADRAPADDGRGVRRVGVTATIPRAAARLVRRPGARACRGRHLRDPGLHRLAAAQGDRHSHGPWGDARIGAGDDSRAGHSHHRRRSRGRHRRRPPAHAGASGAALQRQADRSLDDECGGPVHHDRRGPRVLPAGGAGQPRRPDGGASGPVSPCVVLAYTRRCAARTRTGHRPADSRASRQRH